MSESVAAADRGSLSKPASPLLYSVSPTSIQPMQAITKAQRLMASARMAFLRLAFIFSKKMSMTFSKIIHALSAFIGAGFSQAVILSAVIF